MKIAAGTKDRTIDRTMRSPQADAMTRIRFAETATTNPNAGSAEAPDVISAEAGARTHPAANLIGLLVVQHREPRPMLPLA